jgi:hypothetical protein
MKYSFTCPPDGVVLSTEAKNDAEALKKLVELSKKHAKEFHTGQPAMSDGESMKKMIKAVWRKG